MPSHTWSQPKDGPGGHSSLMERSNLEVLRRRAERLYRDQQAVIDEMSDEWLKEKAEMSQLIHLLKHRLQRLEGENAVLKSIASHNPRVPGLISPQNSVQNGGSGGIHGSKVPSPQGSWEPNATETSAASYLPPGLVGASRRPYFARQGRSPRLSPSCAPVLAHVGSLSPRTEPQNSATTDFLLASCLSEFKGDAPIIDVQEIDPKLEGIPIKVSAVQRPTFEPQTTQAAVKSFSTAYAQRVHPANEFHRAKREGVWGAWEREKLRNDRRRSGLAPLTIVKSQEQAKHILAADESRRLTMHAGHTPNHSFSLFPTMTATESSSTGAHSRGTTPTAGPSSNHEEQPMDTDRGDGGDIKVDNAQQLDNSEDTELARQMDGVMEVELESFLEPADDVSLKGPLMIKNIPAQDEIFWAQVNQRLGPISLGKDALPKVLQAPPDPDATQQSLGDTTSPRQENAKVPEEETSASLESDEEGEDGNADVEADVPLIFKVTSNFGAPFGIGSS
ncbi:hypothetical protein E4U21_003853 [Claviceps maximensis]|nr:hypothetical protein E4U21_003853 [Claviceps maximensis]